MQIDEEARLQRIKDLEEKKKTNWEKRIIYARGVNTLVHYDP